MDYWAIWLIVVLLLIVIEAATVNLVSVWFIASGIISLFVSLFCDSFFIQFGIFVVLGIFLLLLTRPILTKMLAQKETKTNLERIIGMEGVVTSKISKNVVGEVKVDGKLWSAIATTAIKEGAIVKACAIEGVKLVVEKVEEAKEEKQDSSKQKKSTTKKKSTSTAKKKTSSASSKTTTKKKTTTTSKKGNVNKKKESEV